MVTFEMKRDLIERDILLCTVGLYKTWNPRTDRY